MSSSGSNMRGRSLFARRREEERAQRRMDAHTTSNNTQLRNESVLLPRDSIASQRLENRRPLATRTIPRIIPGSSDQPDRSASHGRDVVSPIQMGRLSRRLDFNNVESPSPTDKASILARGTYNDFTGYHVNWRQSQRRQSQRSQSPGAPAYDYALDVGSPETPNTRRLSNPAVSGFSQSPGLIRRTIMPPVYRSPPLLEQSPGTSIVSEYPVPIWDVLPGMEDLDPPPFHLVNPEESNVGSFGGEDEFQSRLSRLDI